MRTDNRVNYQAQAAYLYVLRLGKAALAWEYLRRNPAYQSEWQQARSDPPRTASNHWGLLDWEDPSQDSRSADPLWETQGPAMCLVRTAGQQTPVFGLWKIRGRKSLHHDGQGLRLTSQRMTPSSLRLASDVKTDEPCAITIVATAGFESRCRDARHWLQHMASDRHCARQFVPDRPSLTAILHMQVLQAIDGIAAGASHRQIASAVYGSAADASRWRCEDHWRARVRYLVKRGVAQCGGEYRRLLDKASLQGNMRVVERSSASDVGRDLTVAAE